MTSTAWIGIGANVGDRLASIRAALAELDALRSTRVSRVSSVYDTAPWGVTDQARFLNAVAEIETALEPRALLDELMAIEARCGRVRHERWGPRTIDLDILLFDERVMESDALRLPHPRLAQRAFVLVPLAELAPDLVVPALGATVGGLLATLGDDALDVRRAGDAPVWDATDRVPEDREAA